MAYRIIKKVPDFEYLTQNMPISQLDYDHIERNRQEIKDIINGTDQRRLMIVGPCSAWPYDAVVEYAHRLNELNEQVKDYLKIVMRVYIQKPRTVKGWTGPVNQPDPLAQPDLETGIKYARRLMVEITKMGLPIADEALFTHNARGFIELLSWVAIGARSSEDPEHRIFASSTDCPVGMKNPTHGSLKIAVNGVIAAQHSHMAIFDGYAIETDGNPYAHLVLRGSNGQPNYSIEHLKQAQHYLLQGQVKNPAIIIDVSHDNCIINGKKNYLAQSSIVLDIFEMIKNEPELNNLVKGFMLESFLKSGNQNIDTVEQIDMHGLSITDACLGFDETKELIIESARRIGKQQR